MFYLVQVGYLRYLVPEIAHDHRVAGETKNYIIFIFSFFYTVRLRLESKPFLIPLSSALHQGELDSETIEVIFVHVSVIVQIIQIANQKLDTIIPGVLSHLKTVR